MKPREHSGKTTSKGQTEGVKVLMGDPKKAIIKLALPMILAMSVHTLYNLVDAIWVAGLGTDALAAVGFFFPFFFMILAIATGLGMGGGSAISRRIGAKDREGVDKVGSHCMVFMALICLVFTIPFFIFSRDLFALMGAEGQVLNWATSYARIIFAGTFIIFFANVANAILRAEGDVKRAMLAMVLGGILNIVLDPLFIYGPGNPGPGIFAQVGLGLGVTGAAWATLISLSTTAVLLFYWLFIKRNTYINLRFRGFRFDKAITRDIFRVGIPSSVQQLSMSFTMIMMNMILIGVGGTAAIGVYTTGWRVSTLGILPLIGIATAVVSVTGAMYGKRAYKKMNTGFLYAVKIGLLIEIAVMLFTFVFASQITSVFTYSPETAGIAQDLVIFFKITCLFYPTVALGMLSSALFQGTGKGMNALAVTILRSLVLTPPLALLFAYTFGLGLEGIWWGLVFANLTGSLVAYAWARMYVRGLRKGEGVRA